MLPDQTIPQGFGMDFGPVSEVTSGKLRSSAEYTEWLTVTSMVAKELGYTDSQILRIASAKSTIPTPRLPTHIS